MYFLNRPAIHALAIIAFILLMYSNTYNGPFVFDDNPNIVNNPIVKNLHYFVDTSGLDHVANPQLFHKILFVPRYIGSLTFALNYAVHGDEVRGYHIVNTLIHIGTSLLVYGLILLTFKTPRFLPHGDKSLSAHDSRNFVALFTALLFAAHPVQTQAVTYVVQRFASLATLFWLLSLVSYIQFRLLSGQLSAGFKRAVLYVASLLFAFLAVKTKEMALLLPIVIILYECMFFYGGLKRRILNLVPFSLIMAIPPLSLIITSGRGLEVTSKAISSGLGGISRSEYLFTQFRVLVTYIRLLLFPANQTLDYDYPVYQSFFTPVVALSFLFLLLVFLAGVFLLRLSCNPERKNRHLLRLASFGIFWFFISISVESSIFPIDDVIYEHRLYLPSIGFFMLLVCLVELLRIHGKERVTIVPKIAVYAMLVVTVGFATATYARNSLWQDGVSILEDNVRHAPDKARTHSTLGGVYAGLGRIDEANRAIARSIEINHKTAQKHFLKGVSLADAGHLEEAIIEYKRSIILKPYFADSRCGLAHVYVKQGRVDEAIWVYTTAIRVAPESEKAHFYLGNAYNKQGRREEALNEYRAAVKIKPDFAECHYNLGNTLADLGQLDKAKDEYVTALGYKPDFVEARRKLEK